MNQKVGRESYVVALWRGGRILMDIKGEFLWAKKVNFRRQFVHENSSFWVNFHGHILGEFFSMVITNGVQRTLYSAVRSGSATAKLLLGSANTVQCQVRLG